VTPSNRTERRVCSARLSGCACSVRLARWHDPIARARLGSGSVCATKPSRSAEHARFDSRPVRYSSSIPGVSPPWASKWTTALGILMLSSAKLLSTVHFGLWSIRLELQWMAISVNGIFYP